MTEHTPGPWESLNWKHDNAIAIKTADGESQWIADVVIDHEFRLAGRML